MSGPERGGILPARPDWMARLLAGVTDDIPDYFTTYAPPQRPARRSAVLMLFGPRLQGGEDVVLTERTTQLRAHPGQVSFPGGRVDEEDEHSVAAALREAEEEVGVDPASVDVVADLPQLYLSPSGNAVTPVLAWWPRPGYIHARSVEEVARVARVALDDLTDPANRFTARFLDYRGPAFDVDGLYVWGFTAGLLDAVLDLAGLSRPWDVGDERELPDRVLSPWMRSL